MPEKKTIQVNKEYFSLNGRSGGKKSRKKEKSRKKREKPKTIQSSKKMRKEFLKKIRDYQKRKAEEVKSSGQKAEKSNEENEFENEFSKSLGFLSNMMDAKKKESHRKTEKLRKERDSKPSVDVLLEMPTELKPSVASDKSSSHSSNSDKSSNHIIVDEKNNTKIRLRKHLHIVHLKMVQNLHIANGLKRKSDVKIKIKIKRFQLLTRHLKKQRQRDLND